MANGDSLTKAFLDLRSQLARSISGIVPPREIEDIVQETYLRVRETKNVERIRSPKSFLFATARNLAIDYLKRAESRLTNAASDVEGVAGTHAERRDSTLETVVSDQEFSRFCDAVRYLPAQCRKAFVLRKVYGFSQREIADVLRLSESTVEKHIARGIRGCTQFMRREALPRGTVSPMPRRGTGGPGKDDGL